MSAPRFLRRRRTWLIGIPVLVVLVAVVGPWVYLNVIRGEPEAKLSFGDLATSTTAASSAAPASDTTAPGAAPASLDGTWTVASGSRAGYRVPEILFGQKAEAVGSTTDVTGSLTLAGTDVTAAKITVDLASVASDSRQRDNQFQGRIMKVSTYPTAEFVLSGPLQIGSLPADGAQLPLQAMGDLTVHGATRPVTAAIVARRNGAAIEVTGTIAVTFADFGIPNPSFGPASVGDTGTIEFALSFAKG